MYKNLDGKLTPKIPCVFLPNFAVFDIVGKINFSKKKIMINEGSNCKILRLPCWKPTSKNYSASFHDI
jgi:hypothetical protein